MTFSVCSDAFDCFEECKSINVTQLWVQTYFFSRVVLLTTARETQYAVHISKI